MSFLQQLKHRAQATQHAQGSQALQLAQHLQRTEEASRLIENYLGELAAQLNVLQPPSPPLSLDGRTPWPPMRLCEFRFDARRKILRNQEVTEHVALGWRVVPADPPANRQAEVRVNFPPDLERVEARLRAGQVVFNRVEHRHPESHKLTAVVFEHGVAARGAVVFTADHDQARFDVRLQGLGGFDLVQTQWPASRIGPALLDDIARALVGEGPCPR